MRLSFSTAHRLVSNPDRWHLAMMALRLGIHVEKEAQSQQEEIDFGEDMLITKVVAHHSAGFNHPYEKFANFKPGLTLEGVVEPGEDAKKAARDLQHTAFVLVEEQKEAVLARLAEEERALRIQESDDGSIEF
jgi:hypothetical protein